MKIAQESGLTELLSRLLAPVTKRLFKGLRPNGEAVNAITMNLIANFLGLGNAATPLGIRAMCEMAKEQRADGAATNDMAMFVVVNTGSSPPPRRCFACRRAPPRRWTSCPPPGSHRSARWPWAS